MNYSLVCVVCVECRSQSLTPPPLLSSLASNENWCMSLETSVFVVNCDCALVVTVHW